MSGSILVWLSLLLVCCMSYLQIELVKHVLRQELHHKGEVICITKEVDEAIVKKEKETLDKKKHGKKKKKKNKDNEQEDEEDEDVSFDDEEVEEKQNYREICYEKDISYSIPINLNHEFSFISVDSTVPISWVKADKCSIQGTTHKCSLLNTNLKEDLTKILKGSKKTKKHSKEEYAMIEGSSELVKGFQKKLQTFELDIRDTSKLTNLVELLMLGFYMREERERMALEQTNFIEAVQISKNLNYLCDGAISLRFDASSQNSFLNELFTYQHAPEKYVTMYLNDDKTSYIAIGEIATKFSKYGYGGVDWIDIEDAQEYGKMPTITGVIIDSNGKTYSELSDKEYPAIISMSASYIGIPKEVMTEWNKKFNKKSKCAVDEKTSYLVCSHLKKEDEDKIITFEFNDKRVSFTLRELILEQTHGRTVLNLKQTIHDTYAVLGNPLFQKYLIVFDYNANKVGIAAKRDELDGGIINVVSLVRFICFVFLFGCSFIVCFTPIQRCLHVLKSRGKLNGSSGETRRLKQYSPVQENPYDELSGQIKEALGEEEQ